MHFRLSVFSGRLMGDAEAAEAFPAGGRIVATYDVAVAGFSLGELHLDARFEGPAYKMKGEGKFSLCFGSNRARSMNSRPP